MEGRCTITLIPALPKTWSAETLTYQDLNAAFVHLRTYTNSLFFSLDGAGQTISGANTFSAVQTFSAIPVCSAGLTVTGTGTATTWSATTLTGTLSTASQPNITTLAGLTTATITTLTVGTTVGKILGGSTSLAWRNNADSADIIKYVESSTTLTLGGSTLNLNIANSAIVVLGSTTTGQTTINGQTLALVSNASGSITINGGCDVQIGALGIATNAAIGFLRFPTCAGAPTGAAAEGCAIVDSTNHKLYVRLNSTWVAQT